ncbi:hypothetical protein VNO77_33820 [Canavalia gladiata]|uniref:Uncharacterized protein n=1 Tax=Canavalia gladiata TaxID=3824 RepID=A0AAN9KF59_CANGL
MATSSHEPPCTEGYVCMVSGLRVNSNALALQMSNSSSWLGRVSKEVERLGPRTPPLTVSSTGFPWSNRKWRALVTTDHRVYVLAYVPLWFSFLHEEVARPDCEGLLEFIRVLEVHFLPHNLPIIAFLESLTSTLVALGIPGPTSDHYAREMATMGISQGIWSH